LFGRGKVEPSPTVEIEGLKASVSALERRIEGLELSQANVHTQVRTWMRRAVAAERAAARGSEPEGTGDEQATRAPVERARPLWGARGRRAARLMRGDPADEATPDDERRTDGVHS
jgi:hypothetical protein